MTDYKDRIQIYKTFNRYRTYPFGDIKSVGSPQYNNIIALQKTIATQHSISNKILRVQEIIQRSEQRIDRTNYKNEVKLLQPYRNKNNTIKNKTIAYTLQQRRFVYAIFNLCPIFNLDGNPL